MKRTALEKCGGYETLLLPEDYYLWIKMIAADCKLENIPEAFINIIYIIDFVYCPVGIKKFVYSKFLRS